MNVIDLNKMSDILDDSPEVTLHETTMKLTEELGEFYAEILKHSKSPLASSSAEGSAQSRFTEVVDCVLVAADVASKLDALPLSDKRLKPPPVAFNYFNFLFVRDQENFRSEEVKKHSPGYYNVYRGLVSSWGNFLSEVDYNQYQLDKKLVDMKEPGRTDDTRFRFFLKFLGALRSAYEAERFIFIAGKEERVKRVKDIFDLKLRKWHRKIKANQEGFDLI